MTLADCAANVITWRAAKRLQLNADKTRESYILVKYIGLDDKTHVMWFDTPVKLSMIMISLDEQSRVTNGADVLLSSAPSAIRPSLAWSRCHGTVHLTLCTVVTGLLQRLPRRFSGFNVCAVPDSAACRSSFGVGSPATGPPLHLFGLEGAALASGHSANQLLVHKSCSDGRQSTSLARRWRWLPPTRAATNGDTTIGQWQGVLSRHLQSLEQSVGRPHDGNVNVFDRKPSDVASWLVCPVSNRAYGQYALGLLLSLSSSSSSSCFYYLYSLRPSVCAAIETTVLCCILCNNNYAKQNAWTRLLTRYVAFHSTHSTGLGQYLVWLSVVLKRLWEATMSIIYRAVVA